MKQMGAEYNPFAEPAEHAPADPARRRLLQRLGVLLAAGVAAFSLALWALVKLEAPAGNVAWGNGPSRVVRHHLDALNRGQWRAAYACFSPRYRAELSFDAYQQMAASHREMLRTRLLDLSGPSYHGERAVLETRLLAGDGERYLAHFILVRLDDNWWIDALRWAPAHEPGDLRRT